MRTLLALCLAAAFAAAADEAKKTTPAATPATQAAPAAAPAPAATPDPADEEKTLYAVGLSIWQSLAVFELTPAEAAQVQRGLADAAAGKPAAGVSLDAYGPKIQAMVRSRQGRKTEKEKTRGIEYAAKAAQEPGAVKTDSGLVYSELKAGTGESPKESDVVKVHYRGTLVDGTEFDSSHKRNEPAQFPLRGVIKCWTEGLQKMKVGGKARLVCPAAIAYGDNGRPSIPGGATLVFEVDLLEIVPPTPAAAPSPAPGAAPSPAPSPKQ